MSLQVQVAPVNVRVLKTTTSLVVSAAAGGVGQAIADTSASLYIAIQNTDPEGCEYKVGAGGPWLPLGSRSVANLDVDLSATTVYLRKAPSTPNVTVAIEVSNLTSEYLVGDDSAHINSGGSVVVISTNLVITAANAGTYNGATLEFSAAYTVTLSVGLPAGFSFACIPPAVGNASILSDGTVLLNGAISAVNRAAWANSVFAVVPRASAADSYVVSGA